MSGANLNLGGFLYISHDGRILTAELGPPRPCNECRASGLDCTWLIPNTVYSCDQCLRKGAGERCIVTTLPNDNDDEGEEEDAVDSCNSGEKEDESSDLETETPQLSTDRRG